MRRPGTAWSSGRQGRADVLAFWMLEGRVLAGMSANTPKVIGAMRKLIESRSVVDPARLADPGVPLDALG
ncbi:MAG: oxidoreductase C-terminal domain-containing protein [Chloroflexota bacterium]